MIAMWIVISLANAFMAGIHYSLIVTNKQDGYTVSFKQYAMVTVCAAIAILMQIMIVGRASTL
jgi:hypothetical protein